MNNITIVLLLLFYVVNYAQNEFILTDKTIDEKNTDYLPLIQTMFYYIFVGITFVIFGYMLLMGTIVLAIIIGTFFMRLSINKKN